MLWYESRLPQVSQLNKVLEIQFTGLISAGYREYTYATYACMALQTCTLYLLSTGAPLVQPGCLAV